MTLDPTSVDLLELCRKLRAEFGGQLPGGLLEGKTVARDRVVVLLACSQLEAEQVVDTLAARGFIRFRSELDDDTRGFWDLGG